MAVSEDRLHRHKCFDFGPGWAEIDSAFETSRLGVKLHVQAGCPLNQNDCRRLAAFLSESADWLDELDAPSKSPEGIVVYVITDGHMHHKIGKAVDFQKRLKQLQTGNGRKLSLVAYLRVNTEHLALRVESAAHEWLSELRAVGEWFECESQTALQALYEAASKVGVDSLPTSVSLGEATDGQ
jgi:hypothetical protein